MAITFTKEGTADVGTLDGVGVLRVSFEFEQTPSRGFLGKMRDAVRKVDPDLVAVAFSGRMPVDAADPKNPNKLSLFNGTVLHLGDGKGNGSETVQIDLTRLDARNEDISAFALFAVCPDGFSRVQGCVAHVEDATTAGLPAHLAAVRFNILGTHTAALLGIVARVNGVWQFRKDPEYGHGETWQQFARIAIPKVPQ